MALAGKDGKARKAGEPVAENSATLISATKRVGKDGKTYKAKKPRGAGIGQVTGAQSRNRS
jgi:hypothetical protein